MFRRLGKGFLPGLALALAWGAASAAFALAPLPQVYQGQGFRTWLAPQNARAWQMDWLKHDLARKDETLRGQTLKALGLLRHRVDRTLMWPQWEQPVEDRIRIRYERLGFSDRKSAVLWAPYAGRGEYVMIVFSQWGDGQDYWKPWQIFEFKTDPVPGLKVEFPDILSDGSRELVVRHLVRNDAYGDREVVSIFRNDDQGDNRALRLTWQETDEYYRAGKYEGNPAWMSEKLKFGDQRILRTVTWKRYHYTREGEEARYQGMHPFRRETYRERFSWNPADFSFYDAETELGKLVRGREPELRQDAARRLGEILSTAHPQLVAALKDKSALVRMQAALALEDIGDTTALPALEKALENPNEDNTVTQALQQAEDSLLAKAKAEVAAEALSRTASVSVPPLGLRRHGKEAERRVRHARRAGRKPASSMPAVPADLSPTSQPRLNLQPR